MKKQELFDTLTDLATEEAYNISNAIGLEDYFGVYVTMTNNFDEYIDGFYKPNKNTILHRYIKSCLLDGQWYDDIIENIPEDYVLKIHNEQLFRLFGFSFERLENLPKNYPEFEDEDFDEWKSFAKKVNEFYCTNINEEWTKHIFYVLFANKDFLFRFNSEVAKIVKSLKKSDYPKLLRKDGVIYRNRFPVWLLKAVKMRDRNRCQVMKERSY